MPDVTFSDWVNGLTVDALGGSEKIPLLDGTSSRHITASLLAAFAVDQLHQAAVVTTLADTDEISVFQSDVEKILTAQNFFNWVVDKLEALPTETTIVDGDKLVFNDGGVLKQIDIATVRSFLSSANVALGSQINGLTTAATPLNLTDQFVLAQGSTALKTTLQVIRDRVYTDYLAYATGLAPVTTLANADIFYVGQSGTAKNVTALKIGEYIQNGIGPAIASAPWSTYTALGASANATDVFLLQRGGTGRTATGANIATYVVGTQNSAASSGAAVAGDSFLIFRAGTQYKMDVGALATYVIASGWSAASGSPVVTGDKIVIGRGVTTYSVTVDQLKTFVQAGIQASTLDLTGLPVASLASGSLLLIGDGVTPKKSTLADLETQLWTDYKAYVSGLTSVVTLANADTFYVIQSGTAKKIASSDIAAYAETAMWSKSVVTPLAGDNFWMRRGATSYRVSIGDIASYVSTVVAGTINMPALSAITTVSNDDLFIVDDGAVNANRKITFQNVKASIWSAFASYITGLTSSGAVAGTEELYLNNGGSSQKVTVSSLWSLRYLTDAKAIKLDDFATCDDNTDLNATIYAHGLLPKLSNNTRQFMRGDGSWATYASVNATPTAATGSTHSDAAPLSTTNTTFITCDSVLKGVKLPSGSAGDIMDVINNSVTTAKLYPSSGGSLNNQAPNAGVVIPASRGVRCFCSATDTWTVFEMYSKAANA